MLQLGVLPLLPLVILLPLSAGREPVITEPLSHVDLGLVLQEGVLLALVDAVVRRSRLVDLVVGLVRAGVVRRDVLRVPVQVVDVRPVGPLAPPPLEDPVAPLLLRPLEGPEVRGRVAAGGRPLVALAPALLWIGIGPLGQENVQLAIVIL